MQYICEGVYPGNKWYEYIYIYRYTRAVWPPWWERNAITTAATALLWLLLLSVNIYVVPRDKHCRRGVHPKGCRRKGNGMKKKKTNRGKTTASGRLQRVLGMTPISRVPVYNCAFIWYRCTRRWGCDKGQCCCRCRTARIFSSRSTRRAPATRFRSSVVTFGIRQSVRRRWSVNVRAALS